MYEKIVVPLDGSEIAEVALPYAEELAGRLGSEITLISVSPSAEEHDQQMFQRYIQKTVESIREKAERYLAKPFERAIEVNSAILVGNPAEKIVDYADSGDIDLIIMATHGRSGISRWALGSVADKVMRATERPVVLVRAKNACPYVYEKGILSKILVPLDGSKEGEMVIPYVEELAFKLGAEIVFFQVIALAYHVHISGDAAVQVPYTEKEMEPLKMSAQSYLKKMGSKVKERGIPTKYEVRVGAAGHEIIKLADEINTDLVAMSTHGRSGIGRWVFGSVAERVMHSGNTPVLLVRSTGASIE